MPISLNDLDKLEFTGTTGRSLDAGELVTGIFKVHQPDYVPEGVTVRTRVDPWMFTGTVAAENLVRVQGDDNVASVALSQPLRKI